MEPIEPVVFLEVHEMGTDDDEGPIHDTISHNRLEIRDLSKYDTRGFKFPTIYMLQIHPVYEQLGKNARKGNNKIFDRIINSSTTARHRDKSKAFQNFILSIRGIHFS